MKSPSVGYERLEDRLYDLQTDPGQRQALQNPVVETRLRRTLVALMESSEVPPSNTASRG